jgi:hypothetical protein
MTQWGLSIIAHVIAGEAVKQSRKNNINNYLKNELNDD